MASTTTTGQVGKRLLRELGTQVKILGAVVVLLWALEILDTVLFFGWLDGFGVRPRSVVGLRGIVLAPFLHGGFGHLIANTVPLALFGWFVMLRDTRDFFVVAVVSSVIGGAGVWLFGAANSVHIGASITIFGFLGYLMLRGWFDRTFWSIAASVVFAVMYGGLIWGVLPGQRGISWEGHLFGFLGGVFAARVLAAPRSAPLRTGRPRR